MPNVNHLLSKMNTKLAVTLICAAYMIGSSASLKCYICNPEDQGVKCGDKFEKNLTLLHDCGPSNIGCVKIDIYISDRKITKRNCINWYEELKDCKNQRYARCEVCSTDECNNSNSLESSVIVIMSIVWAICLIL